MASSAADLGWVRRASVSNNPSDVDGFTGSFGIIPTSTSGRGAVPLFPFFLEPNLLRLGVGAISDVVIALACEAFETISAGPFSVPQRLLLILLGEWRSLGCFWLTIVLLLKVRRGASPGIIELLRRLIGSLELHGSSKSRLLGLALGGLSSLLTRRQPMQSFAPLQRTTHAELRKVVADQGRELLKIPRPIRAAQFDVQCVVG